MPAPCAPRVWAGAIVYLIALLGTWLLANESGRLWAVLVLVASAMLAVVLWRRQNWISAFPSDATARTRVNRSRLFYLFGVTIAMLLVLAADLRYAAAPSETFGLAGILWITGIALLLCSAFFGSHSLWGVSSEPRLPRWPTWEMALLAVLFVLALLSRVWNLTNFPDNIYPDEIMTGTVATQSYISPTTPPPSVFSTLWSGIDLPALWFWFVAVFLQLGGTSLAMLRLPAALFGAATVVPLYALLRGPWGRYVAIPGSTIMAFSASNVHYSRLALNNIVTQFFWATCFFFLLRALRSRRPSDWALASSVRRVKRVLLLWNTASALHPGSVYGVPRCCLLETRTQVRGRVPPVGRKLFCRIWSAVSSLHLESEPLPGARSKPPHLVTTYSDQFRRFPPNLENDLASVVRELAWNQHSQFTRHHILRASIVTCRKRAPDPGPCATCVALASSGRVSHARLGVGRVARGRNARGISEQRATSDQSLDFCLPSLLCCVGTACRRVGNGW